MKTVVDHNLEQEKERAWRALALDPDDKFLRNYTKDQAEYVECWEFEDKAGKTYTLCVNASGVEWIE